MNSWAALGRVVRGVRHALQLSCALLLLCASSSGLVAAAPHGMMPVSPCILVLSEPSPRVEQLAADGRFDCHESARYASGSVTYGLFSNLRLRNDDPNNPYELRHSAYQLADETIIVRYADGKVLRSPTKMMDARRLYSAGLFVFVLPTRKAPITGILMRVDKFAGERGIAENAVIESRLQGLDDDVRFMCLFSVLAGALAALLIYNAALYVVLRYRFVLAHCATSLSVMMFMASWSGAIFYPFPQMTPNVQISIIFISASLFICSLVLFMLTFIEREKLTRKRFIPMFFAGVCVLSALTGPLVFGYIPPALSTLFYAGLLGALMSMLGCAFSAWRSGSRSAGYYLFVWSLPISCGLVRVLWAFGLFHGNSVIAESSPSFIMVIEAIMSAFAVTWRIGQLRDERDAARAVQHELTHLAETDSLTGLLNRRAFLERAQHGNTLKQFILVDIDDFKSINDSFGHEAGDRVLVAVSQAIAKLSPQSYLVGRMGGEEFGVVIADLAPFFAQRICEAISRIDLAEGVLVTASAGVAIGMINNAEDWHRIYTAADSALYEAKRGGRNRVCLSPALAA